MILASSYVELGSDEHTFVIRGDAGTLVASPWEGSTLVVIPADVEQAGDVWVNTGDQWGPFAVTTEAHDNAPEDDPVWEDVTEITVACTGGLLAAELVNHDPCVTIVTDPGTYRLRISARGRVDPELTEVEDDDGLDVHDSAPVEHYLIQAWPIQPTDLTDPAVVRETSNWAAAQLAGPRSCPEVEGAGPGLAAASRIGRDVDRGPGARTLCGVTTTISLERRVPCTRRKAAKYLRLGPTLSRGVPSWDFMTRGHDWDQVGGVNYCAATEGHPDQLSGTTGLIRTTLRVDDSPRTWVSDWAWMVPGPGQHGGWIDNRVPLFAKDTTVTATYTQTRDDEGQPWTLVQIQHDHLPIEWAEDFTSWWTFQLAMLESRVV